MSSPSSSENLFGEISVKWNGQEYKVSTLERTHRVGDLKRELAALTRVLPERQKLLGLKTKQGGGVLDDTLLDELNYKPGTTKIMMMGTVEEVIEDVNKRPEIETPVVDDFDIGVNVEEVHVQHREENLAKIERRVRELKITVQNPPRPGKKLLVLDIDYTLFDHVSPAERGSELMRPFLHEFLTQSYEDYDIVIWSATSMKWIEAKMQEIGVARNPNYKIAFYLDCAAMISIYTQEYGVLNVKPLKVIWDKFPEFYSSRNTIMFDDLKRNFLMNPQNGLKIEPFKNAHLNRDKDTELLKLSVYLKKISKLDDLSHLKHKYWYKYDEE